MIVIDNISKEFDSNVVLKDVYMNLEQGKIYGFQGINGSGKTVLFKIICGFVAPTFGKIIINEKEIGKDRDFPESCGVIIEDSGFIERFSGYKNLELLADITRIASKEDIIKWMEFFDLDPKSKKKVKNYSLGMKKKLALIQAVMEKQKIIILDEPMNALDEKSVIKTRQLLKTLKKDSIILISSHNKEDLEELCDEIFNICDGVVTKI